LRRFFFILATFLTFTVASCQTFKRQNNESTENFVKRITSVENLAYQIIETNEWDNAKTVLLTFIPTPYEITVGLMFAPIESYSYKQVLIDSFSTFGNTAQIESVFFFNAYNDKTKELIIMTTYIQSKEKKLTKIYWDLIFDNHNFSKQAKKLGYIQQTSKKINGSKFKNPSDIKVELIKLGKKRRFSK
jgi:hypothetical protein